jgi:hypothetical protein
MEVIIHLSRRGSVGPATSSVYGGSPKDLTLLEYGEPEHLAEENQNPKQEHHQVCRYKVRTNNTDSHT